MKVKDLPQPTLKALNDLIYGHNAIGIKRGLDQAYEFLSSADLECGDIQYARINVDWVEGKLQQYNRNEEQLTAAILHIVDWQHFLGKPGLFEPTLNRLQLILAPAGWTVEMDGISAYLRQTPRSFRLQKASVLPVNPTPEFSRITSDPAWVKVFRSRWDEAERCVAAGSPLSAIVMLGSILEGALLATAKRFPKVALQVNGAPKDKKTGRVKPFDQWAFRELILVAEEAGWIGGEVRRMGDALRDYRNLIHPGQQVKNKEFPTQDSASVCHKAVAACLRTLINYIEENGENS